MAAPLMPYALAALGVYGLYALTRDKMGPRSRSAWLRSFGGWAGPSATSEDEKVKRTERMARGALQSDPSLSPYGLRVFGHGSSMNNTNVRLTSDLDLVVVATNSVWMAAAPGEPFPSNFQTAPVDLRSAYRSYRSTVRQVLETHFADSGVSEGNKTIKLAATATTRVECDVLPCLRLQRYLPRTYWTNGVPIYAEGVVFITEDGEEVHSFPELHLARGREKNIATGYRYKQVVRVLKKLRSSFKQEMTLLTWESLPSSFQIESLTYNVPDRLLTEGDLYDGVQSSLGWMVSALNNPAITNALTVGSEMDRLFPFWTKGLFGDGPEGPEEVEVCRRFVLRTHELLARSP